MPVPIPNLNQLQIQPPQPASAMLQAMEFKEGQRRTDIAADRNAIWREGQALEQKKFEEYKQQKELENGLRFLPAAKMEEYDQIKKWLGKFGLPVELLPSSVTKETWPDIQQKIIMGIQGASQIGVENYKEKIRQAELDIKRQQEMEDFKEKEDYKAKVGGGKNLTEMQLTERALAGDEKAKQILDSMTARKIEVGKASAQGKIEGLYENIDIEGTAKAVIEGRETIENVKNTFGVPIQEAVRKEVLRQDESFNFLLPRSVYKTLTTSLNQQEKQRGAMGSFVRNLNKQIGRVDEIAQEINRLGFRALDLPKRELLTRAVGSGKEKALEAYLTEISSEIGKLATGSQASVRELSTEAQARWNKVHDPNLSINELKIILEETQKMADMRLSSTDEEIEWTKTRIQNLKTGGASSLQRNVPQPEPKSKFEIIAVED